MFRTLENNITKHYSAVTLPTMLTGATDMAYLRAKGMQCYGIGPATDIEDGPKGFWAHSDQERILETEFQRYARFYFDVVVEGLAVRSMDPAPRESRVSAAPRGFPGRNLRHRALPGPCRPGVIERYCRRPCSWCGSTLLSSHEYA